MMKHKPGDRCAALENGAREIDMDNEERTNMEQLNTEATKEAESEELRPPHSKLSRVVAVVCLVIMAALLVWFVICLVTGSSHTLAVLFLLILYPVVLYLLIWLKKVFSR